MSMHFLVIVLLVTPLLFLIVYWGKSLNRYRDLYQKKISPKIPISRAAIAEAFRKDSATMVINIVSWKASISLMKALFGHVEDIELKRAQSTARMALLYNLLYIVGWFAVSAVIVYFSNR